MRKTCELRSQAIMCLRGRVRSGNDGGREWLSGVEVGVPGGEIDGDFDDSRGLDSSWCTPGDPALLLPYTDSESCRLLFLCIFTLSLFYLFFSMLNIYAFLPFFSFNSLLSCYSFTLFSFLFCPFVSFLLRFRLSLFLSQSSLLSSFPPPLP